MIFVLDDTTLSFPDPSLAEEDGLLAIGGDLSTERLILAYSNGIFPWYAEDDPICWYSPHQRCVIFPDDVIVHKSMQKILSKNVFEIRMDTAFEAVIENCSIINRKGQEGTWISGAMQAAYTNLYTLGIAHSVEVWQSDYLVGGLYGVVVNNVFCGESMFSKVSNASKAALIWLCNSEKYKMIDCQIPNDHLIGLGAVMIERKDYMDLLGFKQK